MNDDVVTAVLLVDIVVMVEGASIVLYLKHFGGEQRRGLSVKKCCTIITKFENISSKMND